MPALMFDSDQPSVLVSRACDGCRVATYADLLTPEMVVAAGGRLVAIDRGQGDPMQRATVADIEPGCLSVAAGVALIKQWNAAGREGATAYTDRNMYQEVTQALGGERCFRWLSTLDGTMVVPGMYADVVQFANATVTGFHADTNIVWNDAWQPPSWDGVPNLAAKVKDLLDTALIDMDALLRASTGLLRGVRPAGL